MTKTIFLGNYGRGHLYRRSNSLRINKKLSRVLTDNNITDHLYMNSSDEEKIWVKKNGVFRPEIVKLNTVSVYPTEAELVNNVNKNQLRAYSFDPPKYKGHFDRNLRRLIMPDYLREFMKSLEIK